MTLSPLLTITGADDGVQTIDLLALSREFPFVEWGILYSDKRRGTPRYPSKAWIGLLESHSRFASSIPIHLSLHLCGAAARRVLAGEGSDLVWLCPPFRRVQLNGYDHRDERVWERLQWLSSELGCEFILQARTVEALPAAARHARACCGSVLFDPSGGCGEHPDEWPALPDCRVGVAGGLTPESAYPTYREQSARGASWVDMESGVRTDDRFDLAKVRAVLESFAAANGGTQ